MKLNNSTFCKYYICMMSLTPLKEEESDNVSIGTKRIYKYVK